MKISLNSIITKNNLKLVLRIDEKEYIKEVPFSRPETFKIFDYTACVVSTKELVTALRELISKIARIEYKNIEEDSEIVFVNITIAHDPLLNSKANRIELIYIPVEENSNSVNVGDSKIWFSIFYDDESRERIADCINQLVSKMIEK